MVRNKFTFLALLVAGFSGHLSQERLATVEGSVVDGTTNRTVVGASVQLRPDSGPPVRVRTGSTGEFVLRSVPPGRYQLWASSEGYADGGYLQRTPGGPRSTLEVQPGAKIPKIALRLWKNGVISGRVIDTRGEPVVGARMMALEVVDAFDPPRLAQSRVSGSQTDDRGEYRLRNVPAGNYAIAVVGSDVQHDLGKIIQVHMSHPTVYYPGTPLPEASSQLEVGFGQERTGVDFVIPDATQKEGRVSAEIAGGPEGIGWTLELLRAESSLPSDLGVRRASVTAGQVWLFERVPPGIYAVRATAFTEPSNVLAVGRRRNFLPLPPDPGRSIETSPTYWSEQVVQVRESLVNVRLQARPAPRIRGQIVFKGGSAKPDPALVSLRQIFVEAVDGRLFYGMSTARVDSSARFASVGLPPGRYLLEPPVYPGWTFESLSVAGSRTSNNIVELSTADVNVELTMTDRPSVVHGQVRDQQLRPVAEATVLIFPTQRHLWGSTLVLPRRALQVRSDLQGGYEVRGLPDGEYFVVGLAADAPDRWQTPDFLSAMIPRATRLRLQSGSDQRVDPEVRR